MQNETKTEGKNLPGVANISIEKELKSSFLDYAMSVIVSRALPDVRDGLKPVQRRILYAMHTLGYYHNKSYRKSATVVGEVIGRYHPHGDQSIYQAMVGLVQSFSKRYPLLDGQGNWGSIDGDNAAAMRYTETRMSKMAQELLADIEKETVQFAPNYDESTTEPTLLPSKVPNLLINGSQGIAVGMATSIPPHNLGEVLNACITLLENPSVSDEEILKLIPGPDFPTGGVICGRGGIVKAYSTGHGNVIVRGIIDIEDNKKHLALIIKEIPYQVNKVDLINKIADLVKEKIIDGISNIRDESDRHGIRVVIELKRGESAQVVLNQLYKHTQLQTSIGILMLGLYQNRPMIFTLRELLEHFLLHRKEIITKRTEFDLSKSKAREHVLAGLIIALENIDSVIEIIKSSSGAEEVISKLDKKYSLSEVQSKAILDMRLQRLTALEQDKIKAEMEDIRIEILRLQEILNNETVLVSEVIKELKEIRANYVDERKTKIEGALDILSEADLIPDEEVVVTLTRKGYIKRVLLETYEVQHRGGKGKKAIADLEESEDVIQDVFATKNHDELLFFTNMGRIYSLNVFQIPEASRTAKGRAIINLLPLVENEKVVKLLCLRDMAGKFIVMVTKQGVIKKTDATSFEKIRSTGIRALTLNEGDELAFCNVSCGKDTIVIATKNGMGIRFKEDEVRSMGRQAAGVRGINLKDKDYVVGLEVLTGDQDLLFATSRGYGKRVAIDDFRVAHRGGMGVRTIPTDARNGQVIGLVQVSESASVLLIDANGKIIRLSPTEIRTMGRQAKGVRLIRLSPEQTLVAIAALEEAKSEEIIDKSSNDNSSNDSHNKSHASIKADSDYLPGEELVAPAPFENELEEDYMEKSESYGDKGLSDEEEIYFKNRSVFAEEELL